MSSPGDPAGTSGGSVSVVIRPAAILSETAARQILHELEEAHVTRGGLWRATPGLWERWSEPWVSHADVGSSEIMGVVSCIYDQPTRYCITVFRAAITPAGKEQGWSVDQLCDEAFSYAGLTLASCPRADLSAPPPRFHLR